MDETIVWLCALRLIRKHEGLRLVVYDDATGKPLAPGDTLVGHPTIGYGRCLDRRGITQEEADNMLWFDLRSASAAAASVFGRTWHELDAVRQAVLVDMAHNLGEQGLRKFKKMRAAVKSGDYARATAEMLHSKWAHQVGGRAITLAEIMRTGEMPAEFTQQENLT